MRIFIDAEFNGFGGELISMALVCEDGRHWYGELPLPANLNPWVAEHVVPLLDGTPMSKPEFRSSLLLFLSNYEKPTIVADWPADLVHFFQMFLGDNHTESGMYECTAQLVAVDAPSTLPHHALHDAIGIKDYVLRS